ncbi:Crp/Fnr family transcriptional regulator [Furfurilactobacillus rossiae]|uniref:Crp/Fnr family transcriptional regulator n=1 Tax=Furfurilactobacillus rossiae TaxID=231049 RepID=UPI0022A697B9|nr:Crp/Fnr family transcriptional regulator [Furfurilactobacillus rossiae]MCF6166686.1 Crp/Fnr family transcriptional regulator [Furfurilactobacillus rossiae]
MARAPLFSKLNLETLTSLVPASKHRQWFPKGTLIKQPLDNNDGMFVIDQGSAKVYSVSDTGKEKILYMMKPGDITGQETLFSQHQTDYFIESLEDSYVCSVSHQAFQQVLRESPELCLNLLNNFGDKLVAVERNSVRRDTLLAKDRVLSYLTDKLENAPSNTFQLPVKKKELASFLGLSPETLSRQLKALQNDGVITVSGRHITFIKNSTNESGT